MADRENRRAVDHPEYISTCRGALLADRRSGFCQDRQNPEVRKLPRSCFHPQPAKYLSAGRSGGGSDFFR